MDFEKKLGRECFPAFRASPAASLDLPTHTAPTKTRTGELWIHPSEGLLTSLPPEPQSH